MDLNPSWLRNAKNRVTPSTKALMTQKKVNKLKDVCDKEGISIVVDDDLNVREIIEDSESFDWSKMQDWANGRIISKSARAMRCAYVVEFLKDFNGIKACTRIGHADPVKWYRVLSNCPFTQRLIALKLEEWEAESIVSRNKLIALFWREANDFIHGSAASRVAAASKLAKILGHEVDNLNINVNANREAEFLEKPLSEQEFRDMKRAFDKEF